MRQNSDAERSTKPDVMTRGVRRYIIGLAVIATVGAVFLVWGAAADRSTMSSVGLSIACLVLAFSLGMLATQSLHLRWLDGLLADYRGGAVPGELPTPQTRHLLARIEDAAAVYPTTVNPTVFAALVALLGVVITAIVLAL